MFMFRSRRTNLTKRLKARMRLRTDDEDRVPAVELLRTLNETQLEMLWAAVDGGDASNCVLQHHELRLHVLCCRTWRWPDLVAGGGGGDGDELRRLPCCRSGSDPVYDCLNPYHWSRVYQPDPRLEPPPYRCYERRLQDRAPSESNCRFTGSLTTNGEDSSRNPLEWCKLAYWELTQRVGPLYPVESHTVNIIGDVPIGSGLCLEMLARQNCNAPESVRNARSKIGQGVTLSYEDGCVWVYNRSDSPIFVNSVTLDTPDSPTPTRVPAEQCLCAFDPLAMAARRNDDDDDDSWDRLRTPLGPVDPNSIRISFGKGWGPRYSRQEITSCPCWVEILLAPCR